MQINGEAKVAARDVKERHDNLWFAGKAEGDRARGNSKASHEGNKRTTCYTNLFIGQLTER